MTRRPSLTLVGATGFTGQLTAAELVRRGIPFTLAGRSLERLQVVAEGLGVDIPLQQVDVTDPEGVEAVFHPDLKVIISCAGPFIQLGQNLARAAAQRGIHYLDSTGEQAFMLWCQQELGEVARHSGAVMVNAMAFEYALGDWLGEACCRGMTPAADLRIYYRIDSGAVSRGTYLSMVAQQGAGGFMWEGGQLVPRAMGSEVRRFNFNPEVETDKPVRTVLIPFGEVALIPLHVDVQNVWTYTAPPPRTATPPKNLALAEKAPDGSPQGPSSEERELGTFALGAEVAGPLGSRVAILRGRDAYGLTGALLAWGATRLLEVEGIGGGVRSPAQVFPWADALAELGDTFQLSLVVFPVVNPG